MKVKELIARLLRENQDSEVILQKDGEGNGYSPLYGVDGACVFVEDGWEAGVLSLDWSAEDAGFDSEEEWEEFKSRNPTCVVLWPMN